MSSSAASGPPNDPPKPSTEKKPTPRRLHTLWVVGLIATLLLLFLPSSSASTTSLTFTDWRAKVDANQVQTAKIDPSGKVTGELNDKAKTKYSSRIPSALNDDTL